MEHLEFISWNTLKYFEKLHLVVKSCSYNFKRESKECYFHSVCFVIFFQEIKKFKGIFYLTIKARAILFFVLNTEKEKLMKILMLYMKQYL